jgi:hypothetical protein
MKLLGLTVLPVCMSPVGAVVTRQGRFLRNAGAEGLTRSATGGI